MKFNDTEAVEALVHCVEKISDLKDGPIKNGIFPRVCRYLNVKIKNLQLTLRANLKFAWERNLKKFRTRVEEGLKSNRKKKQKIRPKLIERDVNDGSSTNEVSSDASTSDDSDERVIQRKFTRKHYVYVGTFCLNNEDIL